MIDSIVRVAVNILWLTMQNKKEIIMPLVGIQTPMPIINNEQKIDDATSKWRDRS